jgi:hypothetical protein
MSRNNFIWSSISSWWNSVPKISSGILSLSHAKGASSLHCMWLSNSLIWTDFMSGRGTSLSIVGHSLVTSHEMESAIWWRYMFLTFSHLTFHVFLPVLVLSHPEEANITINQDLRGNIHTTSVHWPPHFVFLLPFKTPPLKIITIW